MVNLNEYMKDGANSQARAVLAMLGDFNLKSSWDEKARRYRAEPKVSRWENCREQGYIISLLSKDYKRQMNIAFFEHRNSDSICAVKWEQRSGNSITIKTANFGDTVYKDKWDVSFSVGYGEIVKMSNWIENQLELFWEESSNSAVKDNLETIA